MVFGFDDVIYAVIQKTRIINPVKLDGIMFNCTILGDEKVQHFGIDFPNEIPAHIDLECNALTPTLQAEASPSSEAKTEIEAEHRQ